MNGLVLRRSANPRLGRLWLRALFPEFPQSGGLMAYGPNINDLYRQAGGMVAKVLSAKAPADLDRGRRWLAKLC
jgi:hypothetical protein